MAAVPPLPLHKSVQKSRRPTLPQSRNGLRSPLRRQSVLSYSMYSGITLYVGDIPLDHLLYYVAFVFFTMALLGDGGTPQNTPRRQAPPPMDKATYRRSGRRRHGWRQPRSTRRYLLERGQVPKGYGDNRQRNQGRREEDVGRPHVCVYEARRGGAYESAQGARQLQNAEACSPGAAH